MEDPSVVEDRQPEHRRRPRWLPTLVAQVALCVALYAVLKIGGSGRRVRGASRDLYFLTVRGGSRAAGEQTQLLRQMNALAGARRIEFVVDVSEYGKKDPLFGNASQHFPAWNVPWYTTRVSKGLEVGYFHLQYPVHEGQILDVFFLDTGLLKDFTEVGQTNASSNEQYSWLQSTLAGTNGTWRIVVGFHPLIDCEDGKLATANVKIGKYLHDIFLKHRVNAYISKAGCSGYNIEYGGISYMGTPGLANEDVRTPLGRMSDINREARNGFLLHRIGRFELDSYLINSSGDAIMQQTIHLWGKQSL